MVSWLSIFTEYSPVRVSKPGLQLYSTWHWAHMTLESGRLRRPMARKSRNMTFLIWLFSLFALS